MRLFSKLHASKMVYFLSFSALTLGVLGSLLAASLILFPINIERLAATPYPRRSTQFRMAVSSAPSHLATPRSLVTPNNLELTYLGSLRDDSQLYTLNTPLTLTNQSNENPKAYPNVLSNEKSKHRVCWREASFLAQGSIQNAAQATDLRSSKKALAPACLKAAFQ